MVAKFFLSVYPLFVAFLSFYPIYPPMNQLYPSIILQPKGVVSVERRHTWIFSGAIRRIEGKVAEGDIVEVCSPEGRYLATGQYQAGGSIRVRLLTFEQQLIDHAFWVKVLRRCYAYRTALGITILHSSTNIFRLVNAEGDGLSGLIIDMYNGVAVVQAHTVAMWLSRHAIAAALCEVFGSDLRAVYTKSKETVSGGVGGNIAVENAYLWGEQLPNVVGKEENLSFWVDWERGQKTGFFIDQRYNRTLLQHFVANKTVLNAFCYSGGFSVAALAGGANMVHSVDASAKAIEWCEQNVALNGFGTERHKAFCSDVMAFLQQNQHQYEVMVLDPPAFAKHIEARHKAVQAYKRLNALGLQQIAKGGFLFTFSCSAVVDRQLFYDTVTAAAISVGRQVRVVHHLSQAPDHPINIYHPEGHYLKGLVLYVE